MTIFLQCGPGWGGCVGTHWAKIHTGLGDVPLFRFTSFMGGPKVSSQGYNSSILYYILQSERPSFIFPTHAIGNIFPPNSIGKQPFYTFLNPLISQPINRSHIFQGLLQSENLIFCPFYLWEMIDTKVHFYKNILTKQYHPKNLFFVSMFL